MVFDYLKNEGFYNFSPATATLEAPMTKTVMSGLASAFVSQMSLVQNATSVLPSTTDSQLKVVR